MKAKTSYTPMGVAGGAFFSFHSLPGLIFILLNLLFAALLVTLYLYHKTIVSRDPSGKEGIRLIPFEVRNGPAISIEGLRQEAVVDVSYP